MGRLTKKPPYSILGLVQFFTTSVPNLVVRTCSDWFGKDKQYFFVNNMSEEKHHKDSQDFKTLLSSYATTIPIVGDVLTCIIIFFDIVEVHVDIEGLTVGVVLGREFFKK